MDSAQMISAACSPDSRHTFDAPAMTAVWDAALRAPAWDRARVWFHGDLHLGNLLVSGGHLSAYTTYATTNQLVAMNTHRRDRT